MRHALPACAALVLALSVAFAVDAADAPVPDPGIKAKLDALHYSYELDEDGDYKLVFEYEDKRSQLVYIRTPVDTYGKFRIREIWSPAYKAPSGEEFPAAVANRLLVDSNQNKLGGWVKQGPHAVYVVKLAADASADELKDALDAAGIAADEMEAALTPGKDDF